MSQIAERATGKQEFELDLSKIGMLVIVPVGCWAYYTTFRGMVLLTRGETTSEIELIFGTIGALIGSAAILILMALTSWILGSDLAASFANQRRPDSSTKRNLVLLICAFLFFFGLSVFFSYTYYHNNFYNLTSVRHVGVQHPAEFNVKFMEAARETLKANDAAATVKIRESDPAWSSSVSELIRLASDGRGEIEVEVNKITKDIGERQSKILNDAKTAKESLDKNRERRATLKSEIDRITASMQPDLNKIAAARAQEVEAEAEAEREVVGQGGSKKKRGRGTNYAAAKSKANTARATQKDLNTALVTRRTELRKFEGDAKTLDDTVPDLEKKIKAAESLGPIAVLSEGATGYDLVLERLRQAYNFPTRATIDTARPHCERLVSIIRLTKLADRIPKEFNCLPSTQAANALIDARVPELKARSVFDKGCSESVVRAAMSKISAQVETNEILPKDSLPAARKVIQACIALAVPAGLTSTQETKLLKDIADFARDNQTDINVFDRAMNSLRKLDGDARMAMAVALAQDLLILVFRFVAENYRYRSRRRREAVLGRPIDLADRETDHPEIRAWKALLRLSRPGDGNTSRLALMDIETEGLDPDVLANVYGTLNNLGRQNAVWRDRKQNYVIDNTAMQSIDRELQGLDGQTAPADTEHPAGTAEWPAEGDNTASQGGHRRAAAASARYSSADASTGLDQRPASRSARRGRLREFLTGSLEPRAERVQRNRPDSVVRVRTARTPEKTPDSDPVDVVQRASKAAEPSPARARPPDNAFDYLSRFSQTDSTDRRD